MGFYSHRIYYLKEKIRTDVHARGIWDGYPPLNLGHVDDIIELAVALFHAGIENLEKDLPELFLEDGIDTDFVTKVEVIRPRPVRGQTVSVRFKFRGLSYTAEEFDSLLADFCSLNPKTKPIRPKQTAMSWVNLRDWCEGGKLLEKRFVHFF